MNSSKLYLLVIAVLSSFAASAEDNLQQQIMTADKTFFDAFNQCDIAVMQNMFSDELEFYHDLGGVSDKNSTMAATKNNCDRQLGLVRTLIESSVSIYPIKDFGAIQTGEHEFCHAVNGHNDCGTFGFTHVWKDTEDGWKVHRVVSYGH